MGAVSYIPPLQVLWLVVYWAGIIPVIYLLSLTGQAGASMQNIAALAIALVGGVIGATWATWIARDHVESTAFVKGTTTIRVIAVAWLAIALYLVITPVLSVLFLIEIGDPGEALGFVGTVGSVSLLAVVGPGYAEYREARSRTNFAA
jgi:uncharacterized membrane protein YsdA (DUF1294 family)